MLDFHRLQRQLQDFSAYRAEEEHHVAQRLERGGRALKDCAPDWEALQEQTEREAPRWLVADLVEPPDACHDCDPRPPLVTVVATDGSQIYPDRHVEPACYLINVGRIAIQYGTTEPPVLQADPTLRYRRADLDELAPPDDPDAPPFDVTAEVVSALRDEAELEGLLQTALEERRSGRPILALADGTLIRWMIRGMKNRALEERLVARYLGHLDGFQRHGIPVASYVSFPGSSDVVGLLRCFLEETDATPEAESLRGLTDRHLFARSLKPGGRSALFYSRSKINAAYGPHRIGFFYVRLPDEVARVEVPAWAAKQPGWLSLIHAVVLDQAEKGDGYPVILAEAHERAVVKQAEKAMFYQILGREMQRAGLGGYAGSQKAASKRAPRI